MSDVYLAVDGRLRRKVALKLLAPDLTRDERFRERFLRESQLAASIDHPNVIPVYEAGEVEGLLYIAMRYVEGTDLKRLLGRDGKLEPVRALALLAQAAAALDEAHAHGLVHRDVKPANILVGAHEHVYLADFGLTKHTTETGLTETGQFMGTADYVSPEQIERRPVSAQTDVYSLACLLYECLTGQAPYRSESLMGVLWAHVHTPPPSAHDRNPALPVEIDPVLARGLAKAPEARFGSCRDLVAAARDALGATVAPPAPTVPLLRRKEFLLGVGATAAAAGAAAAGLLLTRGGQGEAALPLVIEPGSLVRIDPETNEPVAAAVLEGVRDPLVAVGEGAVWGYSIIDGTVARVDPKTASVTKTVSIRGAPKDMAAGEGAAWVVSSSAGDGTLTEIDPETGRVRRVHSLGYSDPAGIATGHGAVWVSVNDLVRGSALLRVDPATGDTVAAIPFEGKLGAVSVGEGAVWVGGDPGVSAVPAVRGVWRIDPAANDVVAKIEFDTFRLAAGEGAVWALSAPGDAVARIDPATNSVARRIEPSGWLYDIAVGDGSVWVASPEPPRSLARIDPTTNSVLARIFLRSPRRGVLIPLAVDAGADGVWVAVA